MAKREDEKICSEVPLKYPVERLVFKGSGKIQLNQFKQFLLIAHNKVRCL